MSSRGWIAAVVVVLATAGWAVAAPYNWGRNTIEVVGWAASSGEANKEALCAIDFDGTGSSVFIFGYRWHDSDEVARVYTGLTDGSPTAIADKDAFDTFVANNGADANAGTSEAMLYFLTAANLGLDFTYKYYGGAGMLVDTFTYDVHTTGNWWHIQYWDGNKEWDAGVWGSGPAEAPDGEWTYGGVGPSARLLDSYFWDGWGSSDWNAPAITPVLIPEPATLGLLGVAGIGLMLRRRKLRA